MATVTLGGKPVHTLGTLPEIGSKAPDFTLTKSDLSAVTLADFKGKKLLLNIFPSVDTRVCALSVRQFNEKAAALKNTEVLCISKDLPFAQTRFCGAEGIDKVIMLSDFRDGNFGENYQIAFVDGHFSGLLARSVVVIDGDGTVLYTEQVNNTSEEPDYKAALQALMND